MIAFNTKSDNTLPQKWGWEIFTDGSKMGEKVGFGVSITEHGEEIANYSEPLDKDSTVYLAEIRAINCAASWCLRNRKTIGLRPVKIFTDSLSCVKALNACLIKNFVIRDTIFKLNSLSKSHRVEILWTKAHVGTEGNERADEQAKNGANSTERARFSSRMSGVVIKTKLENHYRAMWTQSWSELDTCRQSRFWWRKPNANYSQYALNLPRPVLAKVVQATTGFNNLSYHCYNMEVYDLTICRLCWNGREEFIHLAQECTRLNAQREECFGIWGPLRGWTLDGLLKFINSPVVDFLLTNRPGEEDEVENEQI